MPTTQILMDTRSRAVSAFCLGNDSANATFKQHFVWAVVCAFNDMTFDFNDLMGCWVGNWFVKWIHKNTYEWLLRGSNVYLTNERNLSRTERVPLALFGLGILRRMLHLKTFVVLERESWVRSLNGKEKLKSWMFICVTSLFLVPTQSILVWGQKQCMRL